MSYHWHSISGLALQCSICLFTSNVFSSSLHHLPNSSGKGASLWVMQTGSDISAEMLVAGQCSHSSPLLLGGFPIISLSAWWSSPWWSYLKILFPLLWFQTKLLHKHWDKGFNWLALAWGSLRLIFSSAADWCLCSMLWQNLTWLGRSWHFLPDRGTLYSWLRSVPFSVKTPASPCPNSTTFPVLKSVLFPMLKSVLGIITTITNDFITVDSTTVRMLYFHIYIYLHYPTNSLEYYFLVSRVNKDLKTSSFELGVKGNLTSITIMPSFQGFKIRNQTLICFYRVNSSSKGKSN